MDLGIFVRAVLVGLAMAAPIGPVNVLCVQRTVAHGRLVGFVSGLGAAAADALYGFVGGVGVSFVSDFLMRQRLWLRLGGGGLLIVMGLRMLIARPVREARPDTAQTLAADWLSTFVLTLSNPTTIFTFGAVFAGLGMAEAPKSPVNAAQMLLGVFTGSGLWWLVLSQGIGALRSRILEDATRKIDVVAGVVVLGMGVYFLLSA
jgi:threonine/homoserine/homoserine lactone efflux protein